MAIPRRARERHKSRGTAVRRDTSAVEARTRSRSAFVSKADHTRGRTQKMLTDSQRVNEKSISVNEKSDDVNENDSDVKAVRSGLPDCDAAPKNMERAKVEAIEGMRLFGVLAEACRRSGIGRGVLSRLMKDDPVFRRAMRMAERDNLDGIELAMRQRGLYMKGDLAGIFILKHNRKKYREIQRVELSGAGGGPVKYEEAKTELLARLAKIAERSAEPIAAMGGGRPQLVTEGGVEVRRLPKGEGFRAKSRK